MHTLDKDKLDSIAESINLARSLGFSSSSSPVEFLLEAAIDVCLLIDKAFREGSVGRRLNPGIKELDISDELGNAKMIKLNKKSKMYFDPRVANVIKQFTAFFVLLKKSSEEALSFMESIFRTRFLAPPRVFPEKTKEIKKKAASVQKQKKTAYYRRLRKKRTNIK